MDELAASELLGTVSEPEDLTCTHFIIGLRALADQDWYAAQQHFSKSASVAWPFDEFHFPRSAAFLAQMERDPNWPVGRGEVQLDELKK